MSLFGVLLFRFPDQFDLVTIPRKATSVSYPLRLEINFHLLLLKVTARGHAFRAFPPNQRKFVRILLARSLLNSCARSLHPATKLD
jgi:hypothetical protein